MGKAATGPSGVDGTDCDCMDFVEYDETVDAARLV